MQCCSCLAAGRNRTKSMTTLLMFERKQTYIDATSLECIYHIYPMLASPSSASSRSHTTSRSRVSGLDPFDWPSSIPFSSSPFPERFVDRKLVFSSSSCRPFPLPRRRRRGKPGVSRRSPRTLTRQSAGQSAKALRRELQAHGTRENGWTSSQGAQPWPSPPLSTMSATALQRLHCSASAGRSASSSSCPAARSLCLSAPTFMYVLKVLLKG
jgi:hypothetical protein